MLRLKRILENSFESFYWIGFILADGSFAGDNALHLELSSIDEDHIIRFLNFIDYHPKFYRREKGKHGTSSIVVSDTSSIRLFKEQFSLNGPKTKNPPIVDHLTPEQLFCVFIGYIDGDGHIRKVAKKSSHIAIECDSTWHHVLEKFEANLKIIFKTTTRKNHVSYLRTNKRGHSCICFSRHKLNQLIKEKALELNLPILLRKWKNISTDTFRCQDV